MNRFGYKQHRVLLLLLATLVLRVSIPAGYMPAAIGSGLLFELCPEGVPAAVMQALSPQHHHHHHSSSGDEQVAFDAEQCPVGHMLSSAVAIDSGLVLDINPDLPVYYTSSAYEYRQSFRTVYRSRAPPSGRQS